MAVVTNTQVKDYIGVTASTWDTLITTLISRAQQIAENWCGRTFEQASYTEDIDGTGSPSIVVQNPPINSITSVSTLSRNADGTETTDAYSAGDYRFRAESGVIELIYSSEATWGDYAEPRPCFPCGVRNIRVVYSGGYTSVPVAIQQAVIEMTARLFKMRTINPGMRSEAIGGPSYAAKSAEDILDDQKLLLTPYRMVRL